MTYQDQLIERLVNNLEQSVLNHERKPCIQSAQEVAKDKHALVAFLKECKKNA